MISALALEYMFLSNIRTNRHESFVSYLLASPKHFLSYSVRFIIMVDRVLLNLRHIPTMIKQHYQLKRVRIYKFKITVLTFHLIEKRSLWS